MITRKLKILLIDDDPICLKFIENLLSDSYRCVVKIACSANQALEIIYAENFKKNAWFDIVFIDINMPALHGHQITQIVKQTTKELADIPFVAVTNVETAKNKNEFLKYGIDALITKPVTINKLDNIFKKYNCYFPQKKYE